MRPLRRDGFTLVELLLGLVLLAMFAALATTVVTAAGRYAARATSALSLDRSTQTVQVFFAEELRNARTADVALPSVNHLTMSRAIGESLTCFEDGTSVRFPVAGWYGTRFPEAGRDLVLLLPATGTQLGFAADCVGQERALPGRNGRLSLGLATHALGNALLRVIEPVVFQIYRSGIDDWFGSGR